MSKRYRSFGIRAWIALLASALSFAAMASDPDLRWQYKLVPSAGGEAEIVFTAEIPEGWILYSTDFSAPLGPRPARFKYDPQEAVKLIGTIDAVKSSRRTDKNFGTEYSYFAKRAEFRQRVQIGNGATSISGVINGQTCQEIDGLCTLFKQPFQIAVTPSP